MKSTETTEKTPAQVAIAKAGFTQGEIARRLGKNKSQVSGWFSGKRKPDRYNRQRLRRVLGSELVEECWPND